MYFRQKSGKRWERSYGRSSPWEKKDVIPFATLWKLLKETIAAMRAEKAVTVSACAAFSETAESNRASKASQKLPRWKVCMFDDPLPMPAPMPMATAWELPRSSLAGDPETDVQPPAWSNPPSPISSAPPPAMDGDPMEKPDLYPPLPPTPPSYVLKGRN